MGGRGSRGGYSPIQRFSFPEPDRYSVRASHEPNHDALFPFLPDDKMWRIVSTPIRDYVE